MAPSVDVVQSQPMHVISCNGKGKPTQSWFYLPRLKLDTLGNPPPSHSPASWRLGSGYLANCDMRGWDKLLRHSKARHVSFMICHHAIQTLCESQSSELPTSTFRKCSLKAFGESMVIPCIIGLWATFSSYTRSL